MEEGIFLIGVVQVVVERGVFKNVSLQVLEVVLTEDAFESAKLTCLQSERLSDGKLLLG